jgi:hypothetical protein
MTDVLIHQRCWNHELREAVCRCPSCGRHFCRECVTEHASRLLCAACLQAVARAVPASRHRSRGLLALVAAIGGLLLSWSIFYVGGEMLLEIAARAENPWRIR